MAIQHSPGERLAIVMLGSSDAKNDQLLKEALRLGVRTVAIGRGCAALDAQAATGSRIERFDAGTSVPLGDGVLIYDGRN